MTVAIVLAIAIAGRLFILTSDASSDGEIFVLMGKLVATGRTIGVDLLDVKLPGVGFLMSVPWLVFGAWWRGYGLLTFAMAIATTCLLAGAARRAFGPAAAWPAAILSAALLGCVPIVHTFLQLEQAMVFFHAAAAVGAVVMLRGNADENARDSTRGATLLGVAAGCSWLLKPTGAIVLAAALIAMWASGQVRRRRATLVALAGFALPLAGCGCYLLATGAWRPVPQLAAMIAEYQRSSRHDLSEIVHRLTSIAIVLLGPLAGVAIATRGERRRSPF